MNILLDSHTFIWLSEESAKLSSRVIDLFENRQNLLFLSVASVWEMQIKIQLGKLKLDIPLPDIIDDQFKVNGVQLLPIKLSHIWTLESLSHYHKDPFDRLLIAQAIAEDLVIVSVDDVFDRYPVQRFW
jgi:PIN domain nuclease of toxin-antitoxin system